MNRMKKESNQSIRETNSECDEESRNQSLMKQIQVMQSKDEKQPEGPYEECNESSEHYDLS